ncbi:MAG: hypothetical protein AB2689_20565 [Candidatus Thiodiazotropha taylori]|nr:hypothetical protein [Candidatus Thiodiazotropha taylori]MCW4317386.1 hypothetical protein [Candidatus Thiodiazotropha taylori]
MKHIGTITLFIIGAVVSFYGGFVLLGGPDGAILSKSSLKLGIPVILFAALLMYWVKKLSNSKLSYAFAPLVASIIAWLVALVITQNIGFYIWLYGVPASFAVALIMYLASLVHMKKRESFGE